MHRGTSEKSKLFYKELLTYLKKPHTSVQCAEHFKCGKAKMNYHIARLSKSGDIKFHDYDFKSVMHVAVTTDYMQIDFRAPYEKAKSPLEKRVIKLTDTLTQYNLMDTDRPYKEAKQNVRNWVSGSTLSGVFM